MSEQSDAAFLLDLADAAPTQRQADRAKAIAARLEGMGGPGSYCTTCAAFWADDLSRATGECRRFAPRPDYRADAKFSWPLVDGDDGCLEHCVIEPAHG